MKSVLRLSIDRGWVWVLGLIFLGLPVVAGAQEGDPCLMCHSEPAMFAETGDPERFVVTPESLKGSVHGLLGLSCTSCHLGMSYPHPEEPETSCSPCHAGVEAVFSESLHGYALERGNDRAPDCARCHGNHQILSSSDPRAPTHRVRLANTCTECHGDAGLMTADLVRLPRSFLEYARSVHGQGTARGVAAAASCSDCHGIHELKGAVDPESPINSLNVSSTCGQCHPDIQLQYDESIHGRALRAGIKDSPTCTGCHGEHLILSPDDPEATTCGARQATETCGGCHDDPIIIAKYGLQDGVVGSYQDSYHGWASTRGCDIAASCVDCHSTHSVLPEADPASTISAGNVVSTCARCHEGADPAFAASYNHVSASMAGNPVNRIIRDIYLWAIAIIIGGMVLHNLVIINYFMIKRRRELDGTGATVPRFTKNELLQHLALTVGFVVLVITGFALRFPEAWWVEGLAFLGMNERLRGDVHRGAGILLILTSLYHAWYLLATRRGHKELNAFAPRWLDVTDLWHNLRFHTFRSKKKVPFGRYDYMQKAEYWALVWGTIVMVITGLVLWFPTFTARFLPGILIPASQTIHYYEAWLATLAILVWHFFLVILHPEEYPMSWTWITGKMTKETAMVHHKRWYEEEFESPNAGENLEPPGQEAGQVDVDGIDRRASKVDHLGAGISD